MGMEGFHTSESIENQPKNKFLELYEFVDRRTESARKNGQERNIKLAEAYDTALTILRGELEDEYKRLHPDDIYIGGGEPRERFHNWVNSLSVEEMERHISSLRDNWEGYISAKEEDGKMDDVARVDRFLDALEEIRNGLIS